MNLIFYIAAGIAVVSTIMAITRHNAIHALMYLILSLLSVSVIFYLIGAPLVAAFEVLVYAGAIMVLFIFVVMMLNVGMEKQVEKSLIRPSTWIFPGILSAILFGVFIYVLRAFGSEQASPAPIDPKQVGITLFTKYMLAVEIAAMLLLVGIVGSYHLGKQRKKIFHRFLKRTTEKT
ncbi:MAG TPA: NADH-quinone oxidoreductase subunit J [Bacteroidales bacterium]|jgi:NADH-quinone oxidoreductase subunit J|nr:NADH-quinone oxidoreductase subunit J [Bacteroidales bacterium]